LRRLVALVLLLFLILAVVPVQFPAHGSGTPQISSTSLYTLNRYGYAVVNETVTFVNNSTAPVTPPSVQVGLGNLSSKVVDSFLAGTGFTEESGSTSGPFTVSGQPIAPGANASFTISALVNGVVTKATNGSLLVLTLSSPSLSVPVQKLVEEISMPTSTLFVSPPVGFVAPASASSSTYMKNLTGVRQSNATSSVRAVSMSTLQDFNPLEVFQATRTISVGQGATPVVVDSLYFRNLGTATLSTLYVAPLTSANAQVTVVPLSEPKLLNPVTLAMSNYGISLTSSTGFSVLSEANYTLTFQYQLPAKYYAISGGQVTVNIPESPPISTFVDKYSIQVSGQPGISIVQRPPQPLANVSPWQKGSTTVAYGLAVGWAINSGIPGASAIFVLLLVGLFAARTGVTQEEETEEESSTDRASDMISAFDEKTILINGMWSEIEAKNPNELGKEYFDELRGRLDAFRSKALQRLNEVKQKSTTQRFFDLLNQIHATEREVDRAAKDKLNLYEQYYMKRMRKDVYDRLLPQYSRRLERALNQLTDELHVVQREAKLL
jgi:hypothetical protein